MGLNVPEKFVFYAWVEYQWSIFCSRKLDSLNMYKSIQNIWWRFGEVFGIKGEKRDHLPSGELTFLYKILLKFEMLKLVFPDATKYGCWMRLGYSCKATVICVYDKEYVPLGALTVVQVCLKTIEFFRANGAVVKGKFCEEDSDCSRPSGKCQKGWGLCYVNKWTRRGCT